MKEFSLEDLQEYTQQIQELEQKLNLKIVSPWLFLEACTHRSYQNEYKKQIPNNERLEFLGDTVLSVVVSEFLFLKFPSFLEGELSFAKSKLVEAQSCVNYAKLLQIEAYLLLGKGETQNLGKGRDSVIADFFEAIIGAIFLDSGFDIAKQFLIDRFSAIWLDEGGLKVDNEKVLLQEFVQKKYQEIPDYRILSEEGPDHEKTFIIGVFVQGQQVGEGVGLSKKKAQQNAAKAALEALKERNET